MNSHLTQDDVDAGMPKLPGNGANGAQKQDGVTALAEALRTLTPEQRKPLAEALLSE